MVDGAATLEHPTAARARGAVTCPHCESTLAASDEGLAAIIDCTSCGRSFVGRAPGERVSRARAEVELSDIQARSPTDVGLGLSGVAAVALTWLFYVAVVEPLSDTYFGQLFGARGWVPYVIAWLSIWAGIMLVAKRSLLAAQRRALTLDLLPESIAPRIRLHDIESFETHLAKTKRDALARRRWSGGRVSRSFLVDRIERGLEYFQMRGESSDVVAQLGNQSMLDANAVESSYTMLRVFVWAIPLLGFIGTVLGISEAVSGFSDSVAAAVDLAVMKQSIGSVTTGLGIAFETTLLALVMSILIMFPMSSLQKAEEDFLSHVDAYCDARLARRLENDGVMRDLQQSTGQGLETQIARLSRAIEALDERLQGGLLRPEREP